jgi:hypothetical protein
VTEEPQIFNTESDPVDFGTLDFNVQVHGLTTIIEAVATNSALEKVSGWGVARCRPTDRFDLETGCDIAAGRALQELGANLEKLGIDASTDETVAQAIDVIEALKVLVERLRVRE